MHNAQWIHKIATIIVYPDYRDTKLFLNTTELFQIATACEKKEK